jgi:hypothetical protein
MKDLLDGVTVTGMVEPEPSGEASFVFSFCDLSFPGLTGESSTTVIPAPHQVRDKLQPESRNLGICQWFPYVWKVVVLTGL